MWLAWLLAAAASASVHAATECRASEPVAVAPWRLGPVATERLPFHGIASFDTAGSGTAAIPYPAIGVAGLVASVLAHALVVDSARQSEKDRLQRDADAVLKPYDAVIASFTQSELRRRALQWLPAGMDAEPGPDAWSVEASPTLALAAHAGAVELDASILVHRPAGALRSGDQRVAVRVIGGAVDAADREAFWNAEDGERLRNASARLYAESVRLAIQEAGRPIGEATAELPFKTVRYLEGDVERVERAQVVDRRCDRLVIRTLRGSLMSVPQRPSSLAVAAHDATPAQGAAEHMECGCAPF